MFKDEDARRGQKLLKAVEDMLKYKEIEQKEKFYAAFMEVILCAYLASTTGSNINRNYCLDAFANVDEIYQLNWCQFAADYLIQSIREYQQSKVPNINVHGCLHILVVMTFVFVVFIQF